MPPVSMNHLKIREQVRLHQDLEENFIDCKWSLLGDSFSSKGAGKNNYYFQLRAAYLVMMTRTPNLFPWLQNFMEGQSDGPELLSAKIKFSQHRETKLVLLSRLIKGLSQGWPSFESDVYIGQVFSEYLGDLWRNENSETSIICYDRAIEFAHSEGRLLRKKKEVFLEMGDLLNAIVTIDRLLEVEPRKIELSKLFVEKTEFLLALDRNEEATSAALNALNYDRHSFRAVQVVAASLTKTGKYGEVVQALDAFMGEVHPNFSSRQQAELQAIIGDIWHSRLDAPELAVERFAKAAILDSERPEYLRSLADLQQKLGQNEDQVRSLELYVSLMSKFDDPASVRWANDRLSEIYSSHDGTLALQKSRHLEKILKSISLSFKEIRSLEKTFVHGDDWKAIIAVLLPKIASFLNQPIERDFQTELGRILDFFADQSEVLLGDLRLAGECRKMAWEFKFLSENVFLHNYDLFRAADDRLLLGDLCKTWIEINFSARLELVRECIESNYLVDSRTLDQWAVLATEIDPENYDLLEQRLHVHLRDKDSSRILSIWNTIHEIDIRPIRRKKLFDLIREFLLESEFKWEVLNGYRWFSENSSDSLQVALEACDTLTDKVSDSEIAPFLSEALRQGEIPRLEHGRVLQILAEFPVSLRLYFLAKANQALSLQDKADFLLEALNLNAQESTSPQEERVLFDLFAAPIASEWYGVPRVRSFLKAKVLQREIYVYMKYWTPELSGSEREAALICLIDMMKGGHESFSQCISGLEDILTDHEPYPILEALAGISAFIDEDTVQIYISKAMFAGSPKLELILKAFWIGNPQAFLKALNQLLDQDAAAIVRRDDYRALFYTLDRLSIPEVWLAIQDQIDRLVSIEAMREETTERQLDLTLIAELEPLKKSYYRLLAQLVSWPDDQMDRVFGILLESLNTLVNSDEGFEVTKKAALECCRKVRYLPHLTKLADALHHENPENLMPLCKAFYSLKEEAYYFPLAERIFAKWESNSLLEPLLDEDLVFLETCLGKNSPQILENGPEQGSLNHGTIEGEEPTSDVKEPTSEVEVNSDDKAASEVFSHSQGDENTKILSEFGDILGTATKSLTAVHSDSDATVVEQREIIGEHNWQELARSNRLRPGDVSLLLADNFSKSLEQHLAVQVVAILTGQIEKLKAWPMPVWRERNSGNYPIGIGSRYPDSLLSLSLIGPMAKLFMEMNHFLSLVFRERLLVDHIVKHTGRSLDSLQKNLIPLNWNSPIIVRSGITEVRDRFEKRHLEFASLEDLGKDIFFDVRSRQIIFDEGYYHKLPPSHLFHGLMIKFWEVKTKFQIYFLIDPIKELWPLMKLIFDFVADKKFNRETLAATVCNNREIGIYLDKIDFKKISYLMNELGSFKQSDFLKTYFAMQTHLYRIAAAETLDVVGLLEALTSLDLLETPGLTLLDIFKSSPYFQPLFKFILQLKVEDEKTQEVNLAQ